jgi:hypothetical protein
MQPQMTCIASRRTKVITKAGAPPYEDFWEAFVVWEEIPDGDWLRARPHLAGKPHGTLEMIGSQFIHLPSRTALGRSQATRSHNGVP